MHKEDQCSEHNMPLTYFCETCNQAICSDCAMFQQAHKNHTFKHIKEIYEYHVDRIRRETLNIKSRLQELKICIGEIDENIESVSRAKEEVL